jgi:hypothetical protein
MPPLSFSCLDIFFSILIDAAAAATPPRRFFAMPLLIITLMPPLFCHMPPRCPRFADYCFAAAAAMPPP